MRFKFDVIGRVGQVKPKTLPSGDIILEVSVAASRKSGDGFETDWCPVTVFNPSAYWSGLKPGDLVAVDGDQKTRKHDGKTYFDFIGRKLTVIKRKESQQESHTEQNYVYGQQDDEELAPF